MQLLSYNIETFGKIADCKNIYLNRKILTNYKQYEMFVNETKELIFL